MPYTKRLMSTITDTKLHSNQHPALKMYIRKILCPTEKFFQQ